VEAIQGRTMPSNDVCWATANQWGKEECYKNSPEYEFLGNDCSRVQPGTIAVWFGSTTGHIGIITGIEEEVGERRFRFTSAWGNNGIIDIRSFPCSQFDAFIRPR